MLAFSAAPAAWPASPQVLPTRASAPAQSPADFDRTELFLRILAVQPRVFVISFMIPIRHPSPPHTPRRSRNQPLKETPPNDSQELRTLFDGLYTELHRRARSNLIGSNPNHTLQPTALLNEAFIRVARAGGSWSDRDHFLYSASLAMRHVLVDHARRKQCLKRDGVRSDIQLELLADPYNDRALDIEALDNALDKLAVRDPQMAKAVELRFFGGLAMDEVARLVELPPRTLQRNWKAVRAWLYAELS